MQKAGESTLDYIQNVAAKEQTLRFWKLMLVESVLNANALHKTQKWSGNL